MGISNEIKVTSITTDEATIIEIKARITQLPFQSSSTMCEWLCNDGKEIFQKVCSIFTVFVLLIKPIAFSALFTLIFLIFVIVVVALSLLVVLLHKTILDEQQFCPKNQQFD